MVMTELVERHRSFVDRLNYGGGKLELVRTFALVAGFGIGMSIGISIGFGVGVGVVVHFRRRRARVGEGVRADGWMDGIRIS